MKFTLLCLWEGFTAMNEILIFIKRENECSENENQLTPNPCAQNRNQNAVSSLCLVVILLELAQYNFIPRLNFNHSIQKFFLPEPFLSLLSPLFYFRFILHTLLLPNINIIQPTSLVYSVLSRFPFYGISTYS